MAKVIYHEYRDPDFSSTTTPLVSDAAVASLVQFGYFAVVALVGGGLVAWGMWLRPEMTMPLLIGLAVPVVAGVAFVAMNMVEIDPDEY